jgi:hypothetical protein
MIVPYDENGTIDIWVSRGFLFVPSLDVFLDRWATKNRTIMPREIRECIEGDKGMGWGSVLHGSTFESTDQDVVKKGIRVDHSADCRPAIVTLV